MDIQSLDWKKLDILRQSFLNGTAGKSDYWHSREDLYAYDQTFGRRIAWKWDFVLEQLKRRNWSLPQGSILDWGCGSGVAGRSVLEHFGAETVSKVGFFDRSRLASDFAVSQTKVEFPAANVAAFTGNQQADVLLVSHVITELSQARLDELLELASKATAVIWVEPGSHEASRALIEVRRRLIGQFNVVAPCTHQKPCLMLQDENKNHWCHHFAKTPAEVFMSADWMLFGKLEGIDLRSLPLSYLVLDRRPVEPLPSNTVRIIGKPRAFKGYAMLFACDETGVGDRKLAKKHAPADYKIFKSQKFDSLYHWSEVKPTSEE